MDKKNKQVLTWYLVITFGLTYSLGLVTWLQGGLDKFPATILSMLIPMIAAMTVQKFIARKNIFKHSTLGFRLGKWKITLLSMISLFFIIGFIYWLTFLLFPSTLLTFKDISIAVKDLNLYFEDFSVSTNIIIVFGINVFVAPFINIFMFLGEEVGWRGFLYPVLEKEYGKSGLIAGGVIWGLWHAPMILMGHNYPNNPVLGVFIMIGITVPLGIILHYFYKKSNSIFAPALTHGVLNWTATSFMMIFIDEEAINTLIHGPTGIVGIIVLSLFAFIFYKR